jgi:hypothetical protein
MFCFGELSEVHHVEAALVVSFARDGIRLHRRLDRRKIIGIKVERRGPDVLSEPKELTRARNGNDPRFLGEEPRERELAGRGALALGDCLRSEGRPEVSNPLGDQLISPRS